MHDLFKPAHKALRAADARVLVALGTCAGDAVATAHTLAELRKLVTLHRTHQRVEDTLFFPALEARRPGSTDRLTKVHGAHGSRLTTIEYRVETLQVLAASELAILADAESLAELHAIYLELSHFAAENALHMYEEEKIAAPLLNQLYSATELASIAATIPTILTTDEYQSFFAAMLVALSHAERARMPADVTAS